MLTEKREKLQKIENKIGKFFSEFLTPNQYTLLSLVFVLFCFFSLVKNNLALALIFFLISAFLDFIDGAVARFAKKATKKGAYLDTICDRYVEGIALLGFLFLPLTSFVLPAHVWIFLAFFGSLITTYSKAAAKEKELTKKEIKKGLLGRPERIILISLVIFLGILNLSWMIYPIIILAIFSNITAFQRIYLALRPSQN